MAKTVPSRKLKVIVPTLNAAGNWPLFAPMLLASVPPEQVLVIDSESTDGTVTLAHESGFAVKSIARREFNHGGTRQLAAEMSPEAEILAYLTQDAVLADSQALDKLLEAIGEPAIAAAYGRQLPRRAAGAIEAHAREFNYPAISDIHDLASRERLGLKTIFFSNSFAAYRRSALLAVGGFRRDVIFGEDTLLAARLLLAGHKIAYAADACVYHSHDYTWAQEFQRYFDIGVLHYRERGLLQEFGHAGREGERFVLSELRYLRGRDPARIPSAIARTGLKLLGYRLGKMEARLSLQWKRRLSMHPAFWSQEAGVDTYADLRQRSV
jgi:rhamnosyltransferase